jgi:cyclase
VCTDLGRDRPAASLAARIDAGRQISDIAGTGKANPDPDINARGPQTKAGSSAGDARILGARVVSALSPARPVVFRLTHREHLAIQARAVTIAACAVALLGISVAAHAQGGFGPPELTLVPVRDNIYMIRDAGSGNVTVLVGDEAVILIDDKFPQDHDGIMEYVRSVTDAPVRYVINTHMHPDHVGGNPALQKLGADVVASANARRIMAERQVPGLPSITMDESMRIYLDDMPIDLHYFGRGHTDGDIVIHLPEEGILIAGDLFALYGPYQPVIDYSAGGSLRAWTRTLDRVLQLVFDTVIPGHSGLTDRETMAGYVTELARTQDMVREMNRQGRSREDIQAVLESEFNWGRLAMRVGLDGVIIEMQ